MTDESKEPPEARVFNLGHGIWGNVGLTVFMVSAIGAVIVVLWLIILRAGNEAADFELDYRIFRGLEVVLSIAALGLIATLIGRSANVLVLIVGFLVISALVIPTRDLIRITLIATGSEKTLDHYYGSSGIAANISGRVEDTSRKLRDVVLEVLTFNETSLPQSEVIFMENEIRFVLQAERVATLSERVKARGVLELLDAVNAEQTEAFLYRHADNDRLLQDLQFLRYEGLVSIAYDDISTTDITPLGQNVLQYDTIANQQNDLLTDNSIGVPTNQTATCPDVDPAAIAGWPSVDMSGLPLEIQLQQTDSLPYFVRFQVLPGEVGNYQFDMISANPSVFDPILSVLKYDPGVSSFIDGCRELYFNDDILDGSGDLNSQIMERLTEGYYLVGVNDYAGNLANGNLLISEP